MAEGKDELLNPDPLKENEFALCGLEINWTPICNCFSSSDL